MAGAVSRVGFDLLDVRRFETAISLGALATCLLASMILYMVVVPQPDPWTPLDCIYFSFVVMSTLGYGDLSPKTWESKVATIFFAHFALVVMAFFANNTVNVVAEYYQHAKHLCEHEVGVFDREGEQQHRRRRFRNLLLGYVGVLAFGTAYFSFRMPWQPEDSWLTDSLYLTVITVSTVGFGDYSPDFSWDLQVVAILLILVGTPVCVSTCSCLTTIVFGYSQEQRRLRMLQGQFTAQKFAELFDFVDDMRDAGLGNFSSQGHGRVSRFEYLVFMLVKNGMCELEQIDAVMSNFDAVDVTETGFIDQEDVDIHMNKRLSLSVSHDTGRSVRLTADGKPMMAKRCRMMVNCSTDGGTDSDSDGCSQDIAAAAEPVATDDATSRLLCSTPSDDVDEIRIKLQEAEAKVVELQAALVRAGGC